MQKLMTVLFLAAAMTCCPQPGNAAGNPGIAYAALTVADLEVTNVRLDGGEAFWDKNNNAYKYNVKLHRRNSSAATKTTAETSYDLSSYFSGAGDYYVEVQAVGQDGTKGNWCSSAYIYLDASEARDIRGYSGGGPGSGGSGSSGGPGVPKTSQNSYGPVYTSVTNSSSTIGYGSPAQNMQNGGHSPSVGSWRQDGNGWWYQFSNGTYPKNCWSVIDGSYYCFDANGYRRYGWIFYNNKWYYCGADGALMANTYTPDGYYVGSDGVWVP